MEFLYNSRVFASFATGFFCSCSPLDQSETELSRESSTELDVTQAEVASPYRMQRRIHVDYAINQKKVLGRGASGPVKLAVGRCDGRKYAIKSFSKKRLSNRKLEAMENETEIYLSLDHPHIARLDMVYDTTEERHLVMEHMEGGELFSRLKSKRRFSEDAAATATRQMLLAVAYLHARGIAHRDLKLENFLYEKTESDHLKLIDFGIAKRVKEGEEMTEDCGTLQYLAPEVLCCSYTSQADIWSLGVITYMMLTGSPLFCGTRGEILPNIEEGNLRWSSRWKNVAEPAREFVEVLLVVDPEARLTARQALDHRWLRGQQAEDVAIFDPSLLGGLRIFARASGFQRSVLTLMSWSLPAEVQLQLRGLFLAIDSEKSGTISLQDFKSTFGGSCVGTEQEVEDLFRNLDINGSGSIDYSEFLAAAMLDDPKFQEDTLRRTFARFDQDGDGQVSRTVLSRLLSKSCAASEIEGVLQQVGKSVDGNLSFEEFSSCLRRPIRSGEVRNIESSRDAKANIDQSRHDASVFSV